ncbi:MAG: DisA bacterial checkpoint controller nucleotide-binding protein [Syntrophorhabdaceae bacterium PtaU1.Bin034]|jgi:DNA integrity scanning protein DisA with diadenylate cyclase activity|nr:MAG: DisA bacterial checkpoint controller nucleotide-binding protein [Syntrophorhabdaceae bacterium PtaU1.Bin034]
MSHRLLQTVLDQVRDINRATLEDVIWLAIEIAREGREGRKVGTLFVISDAENVLKHSKPLILDPLLGHPDNKKRINDPNMRETIKELAQLDGAFVVTDDGICVSATRYIETFVEDIELPLGLGSRHVAAASITKRTRAVSVVVSESSTVRVFYNGEIISEIIPEIWLLSRHDLHMKGPRAEETDDNLTVLSKAEKPE